MYSYETFLDATIMGNNFDYYCMGSRSLSSCEMVVSNIEVAKITCSISSECKAIVVKPESNWLGKLFLVGMQLHDCKRVIMNKLFNE